MYMHVYIVHVYIGFLKKLAEIKIVDSRNQFVNVSFFFLINQLGQYISMRT